MKEQVAWPSLGANNCNPLSTSTYQEAKTLLRNSQRCQWRRATGDYTHWSTFWQNMSRPLLYSGCEQDAAACEHIWSELASWTLHSVVANKQNRRSSTSSRTVPSGGNIHQIWPQDLSTTNKLWGTATPNSWKYVYWGSKHGWSTTEEEEEDGCQRIFCEQLLTTLFCMAVNNVLNLRAFAS